MRQFNRPENRVGWRSLHNQQARFEALAGIGDLRGKSILDLGCGLGCFYGFLKARGWEGDYTGMDLLGSMVKNARARFPAARFERRDILKHPPAERWDYVFISGIFNHRVSDNWGWMERTVKGCLSLAERGVAFNVLNLEAGWYDRDLFYVHPGALEEKVRLWSGGNYKMVSGYLPEDVTAYLYKKP